MQAQTEASYTGRTSCGNDFHSLGSDCRRSWEVANCRKNRYLEDVSKGINLLSGPFSLFLKKTTYYGGEEREENQRRRSKENL